MGDYMGAFGVFEKMVAGKTGVGGVGWYLSLYPLKRIITKQNIINHRVKD